MERSGTPAATPGCVKTRGGSEENAEAVGEIKVSFKGLRINSFHSYCLQFESIPMEFSLVDIKQLTPQRPWFEVYNTHHPSSSRPR